MTDEAKKALAIAASQWTGVPTPEQIIAALKAAGLEIVPIIRDGTIVGSPVDYVRSVLVRHNISANKLATNAGIAPSTLNRALNDPNHTCTLSTTTLRKIRHWDESHNLMMPMVGEHNGTRQ